MNTRILIESEDMENATVELRGTAKDLIKMLSSALNQDVDLAKICLFAQVAAVRVEESKDAETN